ncbi:MAG: murein peptide amidase A [Acidobacteria bacterium]|nr:MAG: murein peptide amidase A [Acidobacteriota bacterium]REK00114.1 MAG: murein peptide amidase A [Acidobacteriota bacterium]
MPTRRTSLRRASSPPGAGAAPSRWTLLLLLLLWTPLAASARTDSAPGTSTRTTQQLCSAIANRLASVDMTECLEAELSATGASSVGGWPIVTRDFSPPAPRTPAWLLELLDLPRVEQPGRVLLVGGMHGDELSATSIVFHWIAELEKAGAGRPPGREHRDDRDDDLPLHWRIAPLLNPDGLLQRPAVRMNAHGVDLNRNFPTTNWFNESRDYWERQTGKDPRRYPGPYPVSEPESRWLAEEIDRFQPDVVVSVHAPYNNVDFDGPPDAPDRLGPLQLRLMGTYPGSLGRYAGVSRRIPVVTIELPHAGIMPSAGDQLGILGDLVDYLSEKIASQRGVHAVPPADLGEADGASSTGGR